MTRKCLRYGCKLTKAISRQVKLIWWGCPLTMEDYNFYVKEPFSAWA